MGKVKEAAKSLPKGQKRRIEKAASGARKSLVRSSPAQTIGTESRWTDPGLTGYGETRVLKLARGETKLLGQRAIVSFQQISMHTKRIAGAHSTTDHQVEEAGLSIELRSKGGETIEAKFDFLRKPVNEMIRLAGALQLIPEAPLGERVDLACDVLKQAVEAAV
ncbi:MAG TPA: hypothetical protein VIJ68_02515 [Candidatus Saccharimonadales bacterium]